MQLPVRLGANQKSKQMPAVKPSETKSPVRALTSVAKRSRRRSISASAIMASSGMVNSAITRAEETVRNLLYSGKWSMRKCVTAGISLPHAKSREMMVAASKPHFSGLRTMKRPSRKRKNTRAPT